MHPAAMQQTARVYNGGLPVEVAMSRASGAPEGWRRRCYGPERQGVYLEGFEATESLDDPTPSGRIQGQQNSLQVSNLGCAPRCPP